MVLAGGAYSRAVLAQQPGASATAPQDDPNAPEARAERDLTRLGEAATRAQAADGLDDALENVEDAEDPPVQLTVANQTPEVIALEGGALQLVTTSGGADNVTTRQVRGVMRGNFNITYSLNQPACGVAGAR